MLYFRPVVRGSEIVARPMMYILIYNTLLYYNKTFRYLALTYDHRLVDGREAATGLKKMAQYIEDPRRMLLNLWRMKLIYIFHNDLFVGLLHKINNNLICVWKFKFRIYKKYKC